MKMTAQKEIRLMKNHGSTNTQEVGELDDDNGPASNQESEDEDSQDITRSHSSAYQLRRHPRPSRKAREAQARV